MAQLSEQFGTGNKLLNCRQYCASSRSCCNKVAVIDLYHVNLSPCGHTWQHWSLVLFFFMQKLFLLAYFEQQNAVILHVGYTGNVVIQTKVIFLLQYFSIELEG